MDDPEFMKFPIKHILPDVKNKHDIDNIVTNGWVYIKIQKGTPELKQAVMLVHQHLKKCIDPYDNTTVKGTIESNIKNAQPNCVFLKKILVLNAGRNLMLIICVTPSESTSDALWTKKEKIIVVSHFNVITNLDL